MDRHMLTRIGGVEMTTDGRRATLQLVTQTAPTFALEIETGQIDEVIAQLLAIAKAAGTSQGCDEAPTAGSPVLPVAVPTNGVGVMLGPPGHTLLVFRVGCIDLAMQLENSQTKQVGQRLVAMSAVLEAEPTRAQ